MSKRCVYTNQTIYLRDLPHISNELSEQLGEAGRLRKLSRMPSAFGVISRTMEQLPS